MFHYKSRSTFHAAVKHLILVTSALCSAAPSVLQIDTLDNSHINTTTYYETVSKHSLHWCLALLVHSRVYIAPNLLLYDTASEVLSDFVAYNYSMT